MEELGAEVVVADVLVRRPVQERRAVVDAEADVWLASARARWSVALELSDGDAEEALARYDAPALPDFAAAAPPHVRREVLGRFLEDRDSGIVHDVYAAKEACDVDAIVNGTFYHFWSEVDQGLDPCPLCLP